jgi:hypothetical protein
MVVTLLSEFTCRFKAVLGEVEHQPTVVLREVSLRHVCSAPSLRVVHNEPHQANVVLLEHGPVHVAPKDLIQEGVHLRPHLEAVGVLPPHILTKTYQHDVLRLESNLRYALRRRLLAQLYHNCRQHLGKGVSLNLINLTVV